MRRESLKKFGARAAGVALVAILLVYAPVLDHQLGQAFGKNSGWYALGVIWSALDFKLILNIAVGSIPALFLLFGLASHVFSVRGHLSTIELYLARIAMPASSRRDEA